eukprot:TRINITY_DN30176_c0_g1_i1.p3 TRINITY_DN30176_c0_g1~~TRINITY_DN30176_c0_g1_i1.p3  ORF type:complete len:146 (+),score=29.43 TRINITY_DN30176_c0_g1_i1:430-867(+)
MHISPEGSQELLLEEVVIKAMATSLTLLEQGMNAATMMSLISGERNSVTTWMKASLEGRRTFLAEMAPIKAMMKTLTVHWREMMALAMTTGFLLIRVEQKQCLSSMQHLLLQDRHMSSKVLAELRVVEMCLMLFVGRCRRVLLRM